MTLEIYVCSNFKLDYRAAVKEENLRDIVVKPFPCLCINHRGLDEARRILAEEPAEGVERRVLCSSGCMMLRCAPEKHDDWFRTESHCYNHLINDQLFNYIVEQGGYIVTSGWLKHWRERIADYGFDQETARRFFGEFCRELVFLETQSDPESGERLAELSAFLGLPTKTMRVGLENLRIYLRSIVYEWQLGHRRDELAATISDTRRQMAEYSAALTLIGQMATYSYRRQIVGKLKEVFEIIFGARRVTFSDAESAVDLPDADVQGLLADNAPEYLVDPEKGRMLLRVQHGDFFHGILVAEDFLFPGYMRNYASFAVSIVRVGALGLANSRQYELLERSRDEASYLAGHDALTGLYNRHFFNETLRSGPMPADVMVFAFDVDRLKDANDTYGHQIGDELIVLSGRVLTGAFRQTDLVARVGGDEFIVLMQKGDPDLAEQLLERVRTGLRAANAQLADKPYRLSLSMGYAQAWIDGNEWKEVLRIADERMYRHKAAQKAAEADVAG